MGIFDRFFGSTKQEAQQPDITFGRYSDTYKEEDNYDAWNAALTHFEQAEYIQSYHKFFEYLRDEQEDNVRYWEQDGMLHFEFFQGSKKVYGIATADQLKAMASIAKAEELNVGFMRRLMEYNFGLKYSRFALGEDNTICIIFDTYTLDGSPYKLYYALKEMAVNADKQDDLLLDEFKGLQAVDSSHLHPIPEAEKRVKYDFVQQKIRASLSEIDNGKLDVNKYPGAIAYLLLSLTYKLDYLIKPEGYMMETLERIHRQYFAKDKKTSIQKNQGMYKEYQKLLARPEADFFKEMYRVRATFGITSPENHDRLLGFIDGELKNMDWYYENGHPSVALAIPTYIVGFSLFNYALPKPDKAYLHLYFRILESTYFQALGFQNDFFDVKNKEFNKRAIRRAIEQIRTQNLARYPKLNPVIGSLDYSDVPSFAKSYLLMIRNLDLTKRVR